MNEEKRTQREYYQRLKEIVAVSPAVDRRELCQFLDKKITELTTKAKKGAKRDKERRRQKAKRLRKDILDTLTDSWKDLNLITAELEQEDITRGEIIQRLAELHRMNCIAKKQFQKDGRNHTCYRLITPTNVNDE